MKKLALISYLLIALSVNAQTVTLNTVERVHNNTDKFLYRISGSLPGAVYLGELEIQGFFPDDAILFGKIYQKAKETGANAYAYEPEEGIQGELPVSQLRHYALKLYYMPQNEFPTEPNVVYIFSGAARPQTFRFGERDITLPPRKFVVQTLQPGSVYKFSTKKLFGSAVILGNATGQAVRYFQISALRVGSDPNNPGLIFKTGDIIALEKSFAQFLTLIYEPVKP